MLVCVESARVDEDARGLAHAGLDAVDQLPFVVRLEALDLYAELLRGRMQTRVDVGERLVTVELGLTLAEQIQVRAVQHQDPHRSASAPRSLASAP